MEIETMGARFSGETGREHSNIEVTCFKNDVRKVVSMLGDADVNPHPGLVYVVPIDSRIGNGLLRAVDSDASGPAMIVDRAKRYR